MNVESSVKKQKLKIKIFNECFVDMQKNIKLVLKKTHHLTFRLKSTIELIEFVEQMEENMQHFREQNIELLKKVKLLDKFFINKPALSQKNKEVVWKYLDSLYTLASGKKREQQLVVREEPFDIQKMTGLLETVMSDEKSGLRELIGDISSKLQDSLKDKEINQAQLIQDLLSGKSDSSGINFGQIISNATDSLKEKVDSGSIDINQLKSIADNFKL